MPHHLHGRDIYFLFNTCFDFYCIFHHGFLHYCFPICRSIMFSPLSIWFFLIAPHPLYPSTLFICFSHISLLSHSFPFLTLSNPFSSDEPSCFSHLHLTRQTDRQTDSKTEWDTERKAGERNDKGNQRRENKANRRGSEKVRKPWCERNSELWIISEKRFGPHFASSIVSSLQEH